MAAKSALSIVLLSLIAMAAGTGCSSKQSLSTWQRGVERYAADKGDPNALRDVTVSGTRRGFSVIGGVDPKKSTDVNAVLLGHKVIGNRPWFIYLTGLVAKQHVNDIHLAAVTFADAKPRWAISAKDSNALNAYRESGAQAKQPAAQGKKTAAMTTFPRDSDEFNLNVNGTRIEATHAQSGAKWTLDLAAPPKR
jgi:hypothetical protein